MRLLNILDILLVVLCFTRPSLCKKKDAQKSSLQLLEKESKRLEKTGCKSTKPDHVTNLRVNKKWEAAVACLLQTLQVTADDGWAWSQLGDLYDRQGEKKKASTCFQQAAKLTGKLTDFVRKWHFLGPFVIGKIEMDGDPVAAWGGIVNVSTTRFNKKAVFYSELIHDGEVKWSTINQKSAGERLQVSPQVGWNELVMSLGSMAITEWQGWLVGEFAVNDNDVKILVQTLGVPTFYIDNIPIAGEVYHRDQYWFSVPLTRGIHTVYIKLRTKVTQQVTFNIKLAGSSVLEVLPPPHLPDLLDGRVLGHVIPLPIANHHPTHWIKNIRVSLVKQEGGPKGPKVSISQPEISRRFPIAPGQVRIHDVYITAKEGAPAEQTSCQDMKLTLQVSGSEGNAQVQHAAAIPPLQDCVTGRCPVLLTHHGTGVSAQNQADGYKRMEGGDWKFGIATAWTLAPTRHGAHNWEGPGALTSMTALSRLQEPGTAHPFLPAPEFGLQRLHRESTDRNDSPPPPPHFPPVTPGLAREAPRDVRDFGSHVSSRELRKQLLHEQSFLSARLSPSLSVPTRTRGCDVHLQDLQQLAQGYQYQYTHSTSTQSLLPARLGLVDSAPWIRNKVDTLRVIFAGHSMGGHGAWHLATRHPDRALAVVSLAGWIKKEEYGDSNVFFRHDISTSTADPSVKAIMEACIAENDADRHVSNLQGIPVLTRIGADDRTVHPFFVRRMYRLLQETGLNVTYSELPKKEHWWWDTW
ncbi:Hypp2754 [Branchiostoma lanceolatum]|uniref:Hypp2754 protein n=1 Tax=Branchiostoma lanceolatum TaxID=7740 RepID=A0A8J9ZYZ1_BRALA|nr:Hypp2754 [Branchiostoma lanceolatum]